MWSGVILYFVEMVHYNLVPATPAVNKDFLSLFDKYGKNELSPKKVKLDNKSTLA